MTRPQEDDSCGIAQALGVLGDAWSVLVIRDVARGHTRFEQLLAESGVSRKVLAQRLEALVANEVLERVAYSEHPPRFDYELTARGRGALPVLASLQDWGDRWILGDGSATVAGDHARVHELVGTQVPRLATLDPVADTPYTVLYCYPGTGVPGLEGLAGGVGCTLESCTYRDRLGDFETLGASVYGVSTQRPDEQADFARHNKIQFPLLSDADLELTDRPSAADRPRRGSAAAAPADAGPRPRPGGSGRAASDHRRHRVGRGRARDGAGATTAAPHPA